MAASTLIRTCILSFFIMIAFIGSTSADVKLVLIGVAFEKDEVTPLINAKIELVDVQTHQAKEFITKEDGRFYFKLDIDRSYQLSLIGKNGEREDNRLINTESKSTPEVLRTTLSSAGKGMLSRVGDDSKPYTVPSAVPYATSNR